MTYTATYSPDDNKLRLYSVARLDADTYARVRAAGFIYAPKQQLFVAPMWTPDREDLLLELCGEIDDEDTSLVDRAEERAERFEEYRDNRAQDAARAHEAVSAIADGIPLGQPILVGHHSERHARRDAEKIENGMRRAVKMWETSKYWQSRAAGAIRHAKYKERPDVRARRIKGIDADKRKRERTKADAQAYRDAFRAVDMPERWKPREDGTIPTRQERGYFIAGRLAGGPYLATVRTDGPNATTLRYSAYDVLAPDEKRYKSCPAMSVDDVIAELDRWIVRVNASCDRWIQHYEFRLEYERAMLAEAGGLITDRTEYPIVAGGRVLVRGEWLTVKKVNRKDGRIVSVSTNARYVRVKGIEEVKDYQPPTAEDLATVKAATKLPPMLNLDSAGARRMTQAEYTRMPSDYKGTQIAAATEERGAYRYRTCFKGGGHFTVVPVFLTDAKVHTEKDYPAPVVRPALPAPSRENVEAETERLRRSNELRAQQEAEAAPFDAIRESLKTGVQVVSAPQLFPTPPDVARRLVELAGIEPNHKVLEPSAGTGAILDAIQRRAAASSGVEIQAVEINRDLVDRLRAMTENDPAVRVLGTDFLQCTGNLGTFDRIVMNPPFTNGSDIKHIQHARSLLAPGGRMVAICADGPRQREQLQPDAEHWEALPAGTFDGTGARAAICVFTRSEDWK